MDLPSSDLSSPPPSCGQSTPPNVVTDRERSHDEMVNTRQSKNGRAKDNVTILIDRAKEPVPSIAARNERSPSPAPERPKRGRSASPASDTTQRPIFASENETPGLNGAGPEPEPELVDPSEMIEDFNWEDLEDRYHRAMDENMHAENDLMREWQNLLQFFSIWQEASRNHEVDRSFKRLRTRMAHVQNSEDNLEKTRRHYVHVVKAFESALQLLNGH